MIGESSTQGRAQVSQRGPLQEGLACEHRHHPIMAFQQVVGDPEGLGFIRLPRVVACQARQHPEHADEDGEPDRVGGYGGGQPVVPQ
jgi:hypothetical protein